MKLELSQADKMIRKQKMILIGIIVLLVGFILTCAAAFLVAKWNPVQQSIPEQISDLDSCSANHQMFWITGGTFDLPVNVLITNDLKYAKKYVNAQLNSNFDLSDFEARGVTFSRTDDLTASPIIWLPRIRMNSEDISVANHEILHATIHLMNWAGVELTDATEEVYCYELQRMSKSFFNSVVLQSKDSLWSVY